MWCCADQQSYGAGSASLFIAPVAAEDEGSFSVVSNTRDSTKSRFGRGAVFTRGRGQRGARGDGRAGRQQLGQRSGRGGQQYGGGGGYEGRGGGRSGGGAPRGRRFGWKDYDKPARNRDASVNIKADWKLLEEIDFNRLGKLNLDADEGEDVDAYGFLYYYDRSFDKQPVKTAERKLTALDRAAYNVTTSSDPVIQELADKDEATIFATDSVLSMLMCATRSVYPWDIVITRQGNKIFLDKRDNATLDMVTVNENAADAPLEASEGSRDSINQPPALAEEATYINHNFANQVVLESEASKVEMTQREPLLQRGRGDGAAGVQGLQVPPLRPGHQRRGARLPDRAYRARRRAEERHQRRGPAHHRQGAQRVRQQGPGLRRRARLAHQARLAARCRRRHRDEEQQLQARPLDRAEHPRQGRRHEAWVRQPPNQPPLPLHYSSLLSDSRHFHA